MFSSGNCAVLPDWPTTPLLKVKKSSLQREAAMPLRLRVGAWIEILRANLSFRSAVFRHALRLSIGVGLADALGHSISWDRTYWIPMTVAVILKPDFTTTVSRGALRLLGTVTGLMLATVLYHCDARERR